MRTVAGTRELPVSTHGNPDWKRCPACTEVKPRNEENFRREKGGGWFGYCRACAATAQVKYRGRNLNRLRELKDGQPCMDCHVPYPHYVLDYDHRPGEVKVMAVSQLAGRSGYSWARVLAEIAKCDLVCSNCHRKRTWLRANQ